MRRAKIDLFSASSERQAVFEVLLAGGRFVASLGGQVKRACGLDGHSQA